MNMKRSVERKKAPNAFPVFDKGELFYLFDSLDKRLSAIDKWAQYGLSELKATCRSAWKLSYRLQKQLGLKEDAEK